MHPMFKTSTVTTTSPTGGDLRVRALSDFWAFTDLIGYRGGASTFYKLHRDMAETLLMPNVMCLETAPPLLARQRIFLLPRDHRKSSICTVLYILFRIYRNPDIRILLCCNVVELAKAFVSEIRDYLEDDELKAKVWNNRPHIAGTLIPELTLRENNYKRAARKANLYGYEYDATDGRLSDDDGGKKRVWTNFKLRVNRSLKAKEPTLNAISVGQRVAGHHYDLVIYDDIVDFSNSNSLEKSANISRWADDVTNVLSKKPIRHDLAPGLWEWVGAERVIVGTRYFSWDYYSSKVEPDELNDATREDTHSYVDAMVKRAASNGYTLMHRSVWRNYVDVSDGYICPEIYDAEVDEQVRANIADESAYWSQYHNIVVNSAIATLGTSYRVTVDSHYRPNGYGHCTFFEHRELDHVTQSPTRYDFVLYMLVDLASSLSNKADRSAIIVGGRDSRNILHLVDGFSGRVTPQQLCEAICRIADKWQLPTVTVEANVGYQGAFKYTLAQHFKINKIQPLFIEESAPVNAVSKKQRIINTLQPLMQNGLLAVSTHVHKDTSLRSELATFLRLVTAKDDMLDIIQQLAVKAVAPRNSNRGTTSRVLDTVTFDKVFGGVA